VEIKKIYSVKLFQEIGGSLVADASMLGLAPGDFPPYVNMAARRFWRDAVIRQEGDVVQVEYLSENLERLIILND
jgi:hypothetical protein